jgi:hypothetical protein
LWITSVLVASIAAEASTLDGDDAAKRRDVATMYTMAIYICILLLCY